MLGKYASLGHTCPPFQVSVALNVKSTFIHEPWSVCQVILPFPSQLIPGGWSLLLILSKQTTCGLPVIKSVSLMHAASHRPEAGRLWLRGTGDFPSHPQETSFFVAGVHELIYAIDGLQERPGIK